MFTSTGDFVISKGKKMVKENKYLCSYTIHFPLLMTKSSVEVNLLDILTIKMMKVLLLARILAFDAIVQTSTASFITPTSAPAAR